MKLPGRSLAIGLSACALLVFVASVAPADRTVRANEPIVISDDITNYTQEVRSADGVSDDAAAKSAKSGKSAKSKKG